MRLVTLHLKAHSRVLQDLRFLSIVKVNGRTGASWKCAANPLMRLAEMYLLYKLLRHDKVCGRSPSFTTRFDLFLRIFRQDRVRSPVASRCEGRRDYAKELLREYYNQKLGTRCRFLIILRIDHVISSENAKVQRWKLESFTRICPSYIILLQTNISL